MPNFSLTSLLSPLDPATFFADYWERERLHLSRGNAQHYADLLTLADVDRLIAEGDGRYPAIRLAKNGGFFPPEAYTRNLKYGDESFSGVPDLEKIFTEYLAGATVTLPALHRTWPALGRLCSQLEQQLDHSVHTNAYVTPAHADGFTAHYDTHEVFVLQIAGAKRWRIHAPVSALPHRSQPFSPDHHTPSSKPIAEIVLNAGDLLYLPRGYLHSTTTSDSYSIHVTIGVTVYTWIELLSEALQSHIEDPALRMALPPGFASRPELRQTLTSKLKEILQTLSQTTHCERTVDAFTQRVRSSKPRAHGTFHADVSAIGPDTVLRMADNRRFELVVEPSHTVLIIEGRRVGLPHEAKAVLDVLSAGSSMAAKDLPGALNLDGKLALLRYLHGLGYLHAVQ